jgi:hypothetical protein
MIPYQGVQMTMISRAVTPQQVIDLVMTLSPDRLLSVYDFALFVKQHPIETTSEAGLLSETPDQMQAEEEQWDRQFAASREALRDMACEAAEEYRYLVLDR